MIRIKNEFDEVMFTLELGKSYIEIKQCILGKDMRLPLSMFPHLISRLIELGGVGIGSNELPEWMLHDRASQYIMHNYHLIPKADKK